MQNVSNFKRQCPTKKQKQNHTCILAEALNENTWETRQEKNYLQYCINKLMEHQIVKNHVRLTWHMHRVIIRSVHATTFIDYSLNVLLANLETLM